MTSHRVVALAYDGLCTFEFGCVVEMFALARPELGVDWYDFAVCAEEKGFIRAMGGIQVHAPLSLRALDHADTIVIPGWRDANEPPPNAVVNKLRRAHARGARIATICSGVFVLAATGLLDGRAATTHWRYAELLKSRHPLIDVRANDLYVDEGQLLTSAGSAAGLDMMLHLVRRDYGGQVANQVAQRLVIPAHRTGDQAQFVSRPMPMDDSARVSKLLEWLREHPTKPQTLHSLAKRAAMSARTLQRHFRDSTGMSPNEWLIRERISLAREQLESTRKPISRVAIDTGFGSEESFRRHFRRHAGVSPTQYRKHFGRAGRNVNAK